MQRLPSNLFKIFICFGFFLLISCNHDAEKVEKKEIKVREPQDVHASDKKEIENLLSKRINYTTLLLFEDTIKTVEFFKPVAESESPYFSHNGKLKPLADTLLSIFKDARYY